MSHLLKLVILLVVYVAQTLGFALLYQYEHRRNRAAFVFHDEIIARQKALDKGDLLGSLSKARIQLHALSAALSFSSLIRLAPDAAAHRVPSKNLIVLNYTKDNIEMNISFTWGQLKELGTLLITDVTRPDWTGFSIEHRFNPPEKFYEGNGFQSSPEASADVVDEFGILIREEVERLQTTVANLEREVAALETNGPQWQFTEYLYFSVIVLGGGSGDIIPNSHGVRWIVITQYIISVTMLCFVINAIGSTGQNKTRPQNL